MFCGGDMASSPNPSPIRDRDTPSPHVAFLNAFSVLISAPRLLTPSAEHFTLRHRWALTVGAFQVSGLYIVLV